MYHVLSSDDTDRKLHIVAFGVKEDRDVTLWHNSVKDVLKFVCGQDVDVVHKVGFFGSSGSAPRKPRPAHFGEIASFLGQTGYFE